MTQRLCSKLAHKWPPKFPNLCSYFAYIVALKMMTPKYATVMYPPSPFLGPQDRRGSVPLLILAPLSGPPRG